MPIHDELYERGVEIQRARVYGIDDKPVGDECTFRPELSKMSREIMASHPQTLSMAERTALHEKKKQEKIERMREEERKRKEQKELEECTFTPRIQTKHFQPSRVRKPLVTSAPKHAPLKKTANMVKKIHKNKAVVGLSSHMKRVEAARRRKEEEERRLNKCNGDSYTGASTSVQPFQLSGYVGTRIAQEARRAKEERERREMEEQLAYKEKLRLEEEERQRRLRFRRSMRRSTKDYHASSIVKSLIDGSIPMPRAKTPEPPTRRRTMAVTPSSKRRSKSVSRMSTSLSSSTRKSKRGTFARGSFETNKNKRLSLKPSPLSLSSPIGSSRTAERRATKNGVKYTNRRHTMSSKISTEILIQEPEPVSEKEKVVMVPSTQFCRRYDMERPEPVPPPPEEKDDEYRVRGRRHARKPSSPDKYGENDMVGWVVMEKDRKGGGGRENESEREGEKEKM